MISASDLPPSAPPNAVARVRRAAALALAATLVALAVVGPRAVRPASPAPVVAAVAESGDLAAAAAPPTMTVLVGTPHAYVPLDHPLSCADGSTQSAELHDATGVKAIAEVECFYGNSLYVHFVLRPDGRPADPAAADFPRITAGDTIVVRLNDTVITGAVPVLDGEVSADGARLFGHLAPGTATSLAVTRGSLTSVDALWPYGDGDGRWWERFRSATERFPVTADTNGSWSVDLGAARTALRPGDSAVIEQRDAHGNRYVMGLAPPTVVVGRVLGRPIVAVQATNGTRLAVEIAVPGEETVRFVRPSDVWGWSPTTFDGPGGTILPGFAPRMGMVGAFARVPPGTEVSFTPLARHSDDPVAAAQRFVAGDVDLAFDAAPVNGPVRGRAGPGRAVDVRVAGPLGLQHVAATTADAAGVFTATLPAPLDPGWRALIVEREGPISVAHFLTRRHVRVAVGSPFVMGLGQDFYGSDITVTLRAGDGKLLGTGRVDALGGGAWIAQLDGVADAAGNPGPPVLAAPGTRVEVAFEDGDPVVVPVDDITVAVAIDGDGLTGTAPPGARVLLSGTDGREIAFGWEDNGAWIDGLAMHAGATVDAGFDGRWRLDARSLGLGRPLAAGDYGSATVVLASGHALTAGWAPIRVDYDLDSGAAEGVGPPWSRPEVAVLDAAGRRVGRRADRVTEPWEWFSGWSAEPRWQAVVGDEERAGVQPIEGDQLQVTFRSDAVTVPIPPLSGVIHAADGIIVGRSRPGSSVVCTLADDRWPVGRAMTATVDAKGIWLLDARAGGTAVSATRGAACSAAVPPHRFKRAIAAPGLTLDLDRGRVEGRVSAGVAVTVSRVHAGRVHTTVGRSDPEGAFSAQVPGGAAEPADAPANPLAAGDAVTVAVPDPRGGASTQSIIVPPLDLTVDPTSNRVEATTLPAAHLQVSLGNAELHDLSWSSTHALDVPADGHIAIAAPAIGPLTAGTSVVAALWLPSGHRVVRRRFVPRFEIPIGGHRVCTLGVIGEHVSADLVRDGNVVAGGTGRVSAAGGAAVDLIDPAGRPAVTRPGDALRIVHGQAASAVAASLTVPPLTWSMDWAGQSVEGDTLPNAAVAVAFSSRTDCQPVPIDAWLAHGGQTTLSDADGRFRWRHEGEMTAGLWTIAETELTLSLSLPGGHAAVARGRELRADAHVDTPRLAGEADAGAVVTAVATDAAGRPRGAGEVRADAGGLWRMELGSGSGTPTLRPGDRVTLVSGAQSTMLTVQPFGFDVGRGGEIVGTAPPDATVTSVVDLDPDLGWHQPSRTLSITADASGAWAIPATAGRRGWSLAEAVALTASVAAEGRHRTVAVWRRPVDLGSQAVRLALPWLGRGR